MKKRCFTLCLLLLSIFAGGARAQDFTKYVNPLVGSMSSYELSAGNTYPAIAMPWGMNCWTAQTGKMGDGWQYTYDAHKIRGFKQTHQPSPWINDYGVFSIMPMVGKPVFDEDKRASWFSHKSETALPYYYQVYLADYDILAELTPTSRAAWMQFTFPKSDSAYIAIDGFNSTGNITIDPQNRRISGYTTKNSGGVPDNFKNYFVIECDKPFSYLATVSGDTLLVNEKSITSNHAGAFIGFKTERGEKVHLKVASSFISHEQALQNLKELDADNFEAQKEKGKSRWNKVLGQIQVNGGTDDQYRTFYSCLYRSLLFPRALYEINSKGEAVHYSPYNGKVLPGYMYTDTGFWDTFRALFPLLNLVYANENYQIQEGLLNAYRESGFFPEWASPGHRNCMVGNNSASVLTDAYLKGVKVTNPSLLYEGIVHGTEHVHPNISSTGRLGYEYYNKLGYVPCDVGINESVARTLEYAYDDWCIYMLAKALHRPQAEIDRWAKRAMNYKNVFDKEHLLMRGKKKDGSFETPFSPLKWGGVFTEGNSWHYTWSVFQDPQGLINLMGGKKKFVAMLDSVFNVPPLYDESYYGQVIHEIREMTVMNMGNYAHGNQPIQHMIYMYDYAGEPWKAQYWVREVMNRMYSATPDGYCGDEDNGQTSAWYVFSAMGFYPVCPGSNQYALGAPLFKEIKIYPDRGKESIIKADDNNVKNIYIQKMWLNGKLYDKNYITFGELMKGANIKYDMGDIPNQRRGTAPKDMPYSFSNSIKQ